MGADAKNHQYGPDAQFDRPIRWRFVYGYGHERDHRCSPGIEPRVAKEAARQVLLGRLDMARTLWGMDVCAWLDEWEPRSKAEFMRAARAIAEE